jgi:hypothetical protein
MLRRPPHWEAQTGITQSIYGFAALNLGAWAIGFGFDVAPTTLWFEFGPICVGFERHEPPPKSYDGLPDWSGTLRRFVVAKWKLEVRVEYDLNIWRFGYIMADTHDHGIYLGPLNVQIEYDKFYDWPDDGSLPARLQCRCDTPNDTSKPRNEVNQ